jgi:hypothetical protein
LKKGRKIFPLLREETWPYSRRGGGRLPEKPCPPSEVVGICPPSSFVGHQMLLAYNIQQAN